MNKTKTNNIMIACKILLIVILIILITLIIIKFNITNSSEPKKKTKEYDYNIDINNREKMEYTIENGKVYATDFSVSQVNDDWYLYFTIVNNNDTDMNLQDGYTLCIYDINNDVLQYISKNALGQVKANSTQKNEMKLNYDGSKIARIELKSNNDQD